MNRSRRRFLWVSALAAASVVTECATKGLVSWKLLDALWAPATLEGKKYYAGGEYLYGTTPEYIPFAKMPKPLWQALVAIEDERFFQRQSSIDRQGVANALRSLGKRGWSTLEMQLAEMMLPTQKESDRNRFGQKRAEYRLGQKLREDLGEKLKEEGKEQVDIGEKAVLAEYINRFELNTEGDVQVIWLGPMALKLFNKPYYKLSLEECVMLACMYNGPTRINPRSEDEKARERANERRFVCGRKMKEQGYIDKQTYHKTFTQENYDKIFSAQTAGTRSFGEMRAERIDPRVINQVRKEETKEMKDASQIELTIDPKLQKAAQQIVHDQVLELRLNRQTDIDGFVYMINKDGEVVVDVPSFDYSTRQEHITRSNELPIGSTVKPLALAKRADEGHVNLQGTFPDVPDQSFNGYSPQNRKSNKYPNGYYQGPTTSYRQGIQVSSNVMMVDALNRIRDKWENGVKLLREFIKQITWAEWQNDASIVLGSWWLTAQQLAQVYGLLVNDGLVPPAPHYIKSYTKNGKKVEVSHQSGDRLLKSSTVREVNELTRAVNPETKKGYGGRCKKTWTVEGETNGWTVFYNPDTGMTMVCGVYAPHGKKIGGFSSEVVAPIGYKLLKEMGVQGVPAKEQTPAVPNASGNEDFDLPPLESADTVPIDTGGHEDYDF